METLKYNDQNGIELKTGDTVKILDVKGLVYFDELKENTTLTVTKLLDLESNYIEFICNNKVYEFYGDRVVKINL